MYPFQSLPENLAAFCERLRRDHRFAVGPGELQDAARALEVTSIGDERHVRDALRPVLCNTFDDVMVFDRAFEAFFHPARAAVRAAAETRPTHEADVDAHKPADAAAREAEPDVGDASGNDRRAVSPVETADAEAERAAGLLRSSYSPFDGEGVAPDLMHADASWRAAAWALVNRLQAGLSRRWRPAPRGQRFDLRRTLRISLQTGAEALTPRWRARPRRRPRFVFIIDGSRSMDAHAQQALQVAVAIASVTVNIETFTFSTALQRVTPDVRRAAAGVRRSVQHLDRAWGGGTSIGTCLREFVRQFGDRLLGRNTVVIIASDGLDVGATDVLRDTMGQLHRRSAGVIWLNPLLETPGYEPSALGMRVARPYVTTLGCANDARGLLRLSRLVRVRTSQAR